MSTSIMNTSTEISSLEERGKYSVSIIGSGRAGIIHACLFAEAGFQVTCVDSDRTTIKSLSRGRSPFLKHEIEPLLRKHVKNDQMKATHSVEEAVGKSDVIIITTQPKIQRKRKTSYFDLQKICKQVGSNLQRGSLVILASTVGPTTTDGLVRETLENNSGFKVGVDFGLAYSPITPLNEHTLAEISDCKRVVAAKDSKSLDAASAVLETMATNGVISTSNVEAAEAAELFESVQHYSNIALANEFAIFCEKAGIDYIEARGLAEKGGQGTLFSPTLTYRNIHEESYLLLEEAENLNAKIRIVKTATEVNEKIAKHAVNLIKDALKNCGKTLRRARISILGVSQTPDTKDKPKDSARKVAKLLEAKGARISFYDPYLSMKELADSGFPSKRSLTEAMEKVDCVAILTGHNRFKRLNLKRLKVMSKMPAAIVDFEGVIDPEKVENEGLIYRGLGRGVWKA